VLEVLQEQLSLSEVAAGYGINPNQLATWKREFLERAPAIFDKTKQERSLRQAEEKFEADKEQMLRTIGQLTMERDFLKAANDKIPLRRSL
jgi:transposase-like protein